MRCNECFYTEVVLRECPLPPNSIFLTPASYTVIACPFHSSACRSHNVLIKVAIWVVISCFKFPGYRAERVSCWPWGVGEEYMAIPSYHGSILPWLPYLPATGGYAEVCVPFLPVLPLWWLCRAHESKVCNVIVAWPSTNQFLLDWGHIHLNSLYPHPNNYSETLKLSLLPNALRIIDI